jgi:hypothetical protein
MGEGRATQTRPVSPVARPATEQQQNSSSIERNEIMDNVLTLVAGEDLTNDEGKGIKLDGSYNAIIATAVTDEIIGVLKVGAASGSDVDVALPGSQVQVRVSGTVKRGQFGSLAADATFTGGKADGSVFGCIILQNGVSGDLVQALIVGPARHELG